MLPARDNPFEADRIERLLTFEPEWLGLTWDDVLEQARACGYQGAIVGPHGSGKTTFCDALGKRLRATGFEVICWFFNDRKHSPDRAEIEALEHSAPPDATILLVDGIESIAPAAWSQSASGVGNLAGCFVTTHSPRKQPKPRLPVFVTTVSRPEMLIDFVARLAPGHPFDELELRQIFDACGGNLREALWACYDRVAGGA